MLAGAPVIAAFALGVRINWTESMLVGFYRTTAPQPRNDTLALVCLEGAAARLGLERGYLPRGGCPSGVMPIVKRIVAGPGDRVRIEPPGLEINGRRLPGTAILSTDTQGRPLPHVDWGEHRLGPQEFWLLGDPRSRSWDSRYFGSVSEQQIIGSATPLLTWGAVRPSAETSRPAVRRRVNGRPRAVGPAVH